MDSKLREEIDKIISRAESNSLAPEWQKSDYTAQILSLLAPELEKARKYDESLPLIQEMEEKARKWDKHKDALIPVEEYKNGLADAEKWRKVRDIIDPSQLRTLAAWIDIKYPNDPNPQVQNDLRKWADALEGEEKG